MAIEEKDVQWVEPPSIGLWEAMYLPAIVEGLATTVRHAFQRPVTEQYPEERPELPLNYRGVHRLNRDEQGRVKCVACMLCATACPAHCIDIIGEAAPWEDRDKYPVKFDIDELRCIYCGMCEEACPVDAIELTSIFDLTGLSRQEMVFDKEKLLSVYDQTVPGGKDPARTTRGVLGPASEILEAHERLAPPIDEISAGSPGQGAQPPEGRAAHAPAAHAPAADAQAAQAQAASGNGPAGRMAPAVMDK